MGVGLVFVVSILLLSWVILIHLVYKNSSEKKEDDQKDGKIELLTILLCTLIVGAVMFLVGFSTGKSSTFLLIN